MEKKDPIHQKIDCRQVVESLPAYLEGQTSEEVTERIEIHLEQCSRCGTAIAGLFDQMTPESEEFDLVQTILNATSGPACGNVRMKLVDSRIEELLKQDPLLDQHLEFCSECRQLADVLIGFEIELPRLTDVEIPDDLTEQILSVTSQRRPDIWQSLKEAWTRIQSRPRFSLEAAYVGALLILSLITFLPAERMREQSAESLAGIDLEINGFRNPVSRSIQEIWIQGGDQAKQFGNLASETAEDLVIGIQQTASEGKKIGIETTEQVLNKASLTGAAIQQTGIKFWQSILSSVEKDQPDPPSS